MLSNILFRRTARVVEQSGSADLVGTRRRIRAAGINTIHTTRIPNHQAIIILGVHKLVVRTIQLSKLPTDETIPAFNLRRLINALRQQAMNTSKLWKAAFKLGKKQGFP